MLGDYTITELCNYLIPGVSKFEISSLGSIKDEHTRLGTQKRDESCEDIDLDSMTYSVYGWNVSYHSGGSEDRITISEPLEGILLDRALIILEIAALQKSKKEEAVKQKLIREKLDASELYSKIKSIK